jgi:hypothetical protein
LLGLQLYYAASPTTPSPQTRTELEAKIAQT